MAAKRATSKMALMQLMPILMERLIDRKITER